MLLWSTWDRVTNDPSAYKRESIYEKNPAAASLPTGRAIWKAVVLKTHKVNKSP